MKKKAIYAKSHVSLAVCVALGITLGSSPSFAGTRDTAAITKGASKLLFGLGGAAIPIPSTADRDTGKVTIDVIASDSTTDLKVALEALGGKVTGVSNQIVSVKLPVSELPKLENMSEVQFARPILAMTNRGSVNSQGDWTQRSKRARRVHGVKGRGIRVGVLSDSFDCGPGSYGADKGSRDLRRDIHILDDTACPGSDEGRAMAQIIADVAPAAHQSFHTAFNGQADFAQGIHDLADDGSDVIVDDVLYFAEPWFQDGVIAQAVDAVTAEGVSYFSSAGNNGRHSYQAAFSDSGELGILGSPLHDFDPDPSNVDNYLRVRQSGWTLYVLQWDQPFFSVSGGAGSQSDMDLCVLNVTSNNYYCSATMNINGDPIEIVAVPGSGSMEIDITAYSGAHPGLMKIVSYFGAGDFLDNYEGTNAGTIVGHSNAAGANSVGASAYSYFRDYREYILNSYSSAGGTPILFNEFGTRLSSIDRHKPDFTAPDGVNNTFFGFDFDRDGHPNFFGTSAAAPHAAGVGALMLEKKPSLSPAGINRILKDTASDMVWRDDIDPWFPHRYYTELGIGFDEDSGAGHINAKLAVDEAAIVAHLLGDVDGNGCVNRLDLIAAIRLIRDGEYNISADMNGDGILDHVDLGLLRRAFSRSCSSSA